MSILFHLHQIVISNHPYKHMVTSFLVALLVAIQAILLVLKGFHLDLALILI